MKKALLPLVFSIAITLTWAQVPTWSEHIAPIVYENCTGCHRAGNIGPFPIESYQDFTSYSSIIRVAVESGIMPPWPPDTSYQRYAHERILTQKEKDDIVAFIGNGMPPGDTTLAPPKPNFPVGSVLGQPDMQITIPTYASKAGADDEYKCFYLPTNLTKERKVKAIEIIPGNREIVHHVLVYAGDASSAPADSACKTQGLKLMTGYTPGAGPTVFPNGQTVKMGMSLPAGAVLVLQIHYPAGTLGKVDSTAVNLFFYPENETGVREVSADAILQNWGLAIPPNNVTNYTAQYPPGTGVIPADFSLLSVFPHMHLIGTYIDAYGLSGAGDTIKLAKIPHWDFEWQGFYNFKKIVKLPAGSRLHANATYDNTTANPHNPSNPPQWVFAGEATTDEMFLVYFHYLLYQPGDELLDLDSLLNVTSTDNLARHVPNNLAVYPNPSSGSVHLAFTVEDPGNNELAVYDLNGKQVHTFNTTGLGKGRHYVEWDSSNLPAGIYMARYRSGNRLHTKKVSLVR